MKQLSIISLLLYLISVFGYEIEIINQWTLASYNIPYGSGFEEKFKPERVFFTGVEITDDRIFLATPRVFSGVPATLASISRNTPPGSSPTLEAYPSWIWHMAGLERNYTDCSQLISVYRIKKDSCNRLWVLDAGVLTSLEDYRPTCPPKIMIFDLKTDTVVRRILFPREALRPNSLLTNLVIDESVQGACDAAFVYITDTVAPGIVVYDSLKGAAWRVSHPSMFPDPNFSDARIQGETFTLMDGIIGISHSPKLAMLYYQPFATDKLFGIPTVALRNGPLRELEVLPVTLLGRKSSQGVGLAVDVNDDTIYFAPTSETSLATWNPQTNHHRVIAQDVEKLQFISDIRYADKDNGNIWFISTRFQKFLRRSLNPLEINLRVMRLVKNPGFNYVTNNRLYYF